MGDLLSPVLNVSREAGVGLGAILGLVVGLAAIPDLARSIQQSWDMEHQKAAREGRTLSAFGDWTHPTRLPMVLRMAWFIVLAVVGLSMRIKLTAAQNWAYILWLLPVFLGFGLSGLIMVLRKEDVRSGPSGLRVVRDGWAIVNGIAGMIFGFGGALALILGFVQDGK